MINPAEGGDFHLAKTGDFGVAVDICSTVTGGIYDSKGRNVTTTPEGKPLTDKERRIAERYSMRQNGSTWEIDYVVQEGAC